MYGDGQVRETRSFYRTGKEALHQMGTSRRAFKITTTAPIDEKAHIQPKYDQAFMYSLRCIANHKP